MKSDDESSSDGYAGDILGWMALHWLVAACISGRGKKDLRNYSVLQSSKQVSRRGIIRLELDKGHNVVREGKTRTIQSMDSSALHEKRKLEQE